MRHYTTLIAIVIFNLTGCATKTEFKPGSPIAGYSNIYEAECALGTQAKDVQQFHGLLYYSFEHSLRYPGMVVGIEKSADHLVKRGAEKVAAQQEKPMPGESSLLHNIVFGGSKAMFISHIIKTNNSGHAEPTPLYNVYHEAKRIEDSEYKPGGPVDCNGRPVDGRLDAYSKSWDAVELLKNTLLEELNKGDYTDVIVIAMGWNTNQVEAVQNYNSLVRNLTKAAESKKSTFKPYVIGITWPSEWINPWLPDAAVRGASLVNKANDADEVGSTWMGAVIQHGILEVTQVPQHKSVRVTVLGHSFGARATSMAVCNGIILKPPAKYRFSSSPPASGSVSWLVGLQGAYSLNRNLPDGAGIYNLRYDGCPVANRQLITASVNDTAAQTPSSILWGIPFVGQKSAWELMKKGPHRQKFNFYTADKNGGLPTEEKSPAGAVWEYVDASALIFFNAYGTGGGAHSDIYRPEMGKLLWRFLSPQQ